MLPAPTIRTRLAEAERPLLLLVSQIGQVGVEQVVRVVPTTGCRQLHDVDQHFGKRVACVRSVRAAIHLEIEEETAVARKDGYLMHRAVTLKLSEGRNLLQARPVFVLENDARGILGDDPPDHSRRHDD